MYVGDVYKVKNDVVSISPTEMKPTNYPIIVDGITVYYAGNKFHYRAYTASAKYENRLKWLHIFKN